MNRSAASEGLDPVVAKAIIHKLGSFGTPPEFGVEYFSVGLENYLRVMEKEYLDGILKCNLSSFKLVTGNYGGGKTHFLYLIRDLAWRYNYLTSYVSLSATECPFDRLELVYKKVVANLTAPLAPAEMLKRWDCGIEDLLRKWHGRAHGRRNLVDDVKSLESTSFANAIKGAMLNLAGDDEERFSAIVQWLKGEETARDLRLQYRISERVDRASAFRMLRSLIQFVGGIGYRGLILLFDEAERGMSISSARDKRRALDNLRQIIDECGNARLPGAMFFYAVPDENLLLEGTGGVYEALKQRLRSSFTKVNPVGVRVDLEEIGMAPAPFLTALSRRLTSVFETAYDCRFDPAVLEPSLDNLVKAALELQVLDISYRRLFVVAIIEMFQRLRSKPEPIGSETGRSLLRATARMLVEKEKEGVEAEEY